MNKFSRRVLQHQLALAGLLGAGTFVFQSQTYAYGSLDDDMVINLDGVKIVADKTYNGALTGVFNNRGLTAIKLGSSSKVIADGNGSFATGIFLGGDASTLSASGLGVNVKGSTVYGIEVSGKKGSVTLGTGGSISVEGTSGHAIHVSNASSLQANGITINSNIDGIKVQGHGSSVNLGSGSSITSNSTAIYALSSANGPAKFTASRLTVDTQGLNAYGVNIQLNAIVDLGTGSLIATHGPDAAGAWVQGEFKADAVRIITTGDGSVALFVDSDGTAIIGADSHLSAEQGGGLIAKEEGSKNGSRIDFFGSVTQPNTIFSRESYGAVARSAGSVVNLKNTEITIAHNNPKSQSSYGLLAEEGGEINGENLTMDVAAGGHGVYAIKGSKIALTGDTVIRLADNTGLAIATANDNGYAPSTITGIGKMTIDGGVCARGNGIIDLTMDSGSRLTGGTSVENDGKVNMGLTGSRWNMSQDSSVSKLVLNNSIVDFTEDKTGSILSVGDLSGHGTFIMRINIVGDFADKLVVTGTSAGNHNIRVLNRGSLATRGNEVITVVETQDGQASFRLQNTSRAVELGGYRYNIRRNALNANHWELFSSGKNLTSTSDNSGNFLNVGYLLNYAETQTLLQRMGALRQTKNSQGDVWVRAFTGKFDSFGRGKLSGFDMDYTGIQLGVDRRLNIADADVYLGLMGGSTKADSNYQKGDGDVKGYHFGAYGTYVTPNNFYVDGILKYSRLKNSFNVTDTQDNRIIGSASSDGYGLSVGVGKRFYLNAKTAGYYIEPQAQLSYLHQDSSSSASNGLTVDLDSYDSTLARASAIIGYEAKEGKNPVNVYFKTGYVTEMSGNAGYRLNGNLEKHDFGGGWWENGIGIATQLNKKHNLYIDGTYATGSKFDQMQINAGYRYSF